MSSSATSADSDISSVLSRAEKRATSPSHSPHPKRQRASVAVDQQVWDADPHQAAAQSDAVDGSSSPKIQLPSIFSAFEDPFRQEARRASLPALSSEAPRGRLPAYQTSSRAQPSATHPHVPSALASYQFPPTQPQSQTYADDEKAYRPRLGADTQLGLSFSDPSSSLPSATTALSAPANASSNYSSPLSPDYALPRSQGLPSLQFSESDHWSTHPSSVSLPGIVRPSSTPGHTPALGLKYEDSIRHTSLAGPYNMSQNNNSQSASMYGGAARISGQDRRTSYAQSSSTEGTKDDWSFPSPDFLLPSTNNSYATSASTNSAGASPSPSRSPGTASVPPPPPQLERPTKKRGKLPKATTDFLKDWLHRHSDHPYPSEEEKKQLCAATGLSMSQVSNWMINVRALSAVTCRVADGTIDYI